MITYFEVSNFKSIKLLQLKMRPFMVLVGPNGAGKTNIVRALELFGELIRRGTTDPVREQGYDQLIRREAKPARGGLSFTLRLELPNEVAAMSLRDSPEGDQPISIEMTLRLAGSVQSEDVKVEKEELILKRGLEVFRLRIEGKNVEVDAGNDPVLHSLNRFFLVRRLRTPAGSLAKPREAPSGQELKDEIQYALSQEEDPEGRVLRILSWHRLLTPWTRYIRDAVEVTRIRLDSSSLRKDSAFEESSRSRLIGPNGEGLAAAVGRLRGHNIPGPGFRTVLAALQEVYPRIEDVRADRSAPGRLFLLFKERGIKEELGQSNVSDGVLHALALLLAIEGGLGGQGLLAIEEPENAIHPWSLRKMIERAQERRQGRQLMITTHSETLVNAVKDPESLFVVENTSGGTTAVPATDLASALESILTESGQKLGDVWMDGTLGGVPGSQS